MCLIIRDMYFFIKLSWRRVRVVSHFAEATLKLYMRRIWAYFEKVFKLLGDSCENYSGDISSYSVNTTFLESREVLWDSLWKLSRRRLRDGIKYWRRFSYFLSVAKTKWDTSVPHLYLFYHGWLSTWIFDNFVEWWWGGRIQTGKGEDSWFSTHDTQILSRA